MSQAIENACGGLRKPCGDVYPHTPTQASAPLRGGAEPAKGGDDKPRSLTRAERVWAIRLGQQARMLLNQAAYARDMAKARGEDTTELDAVIAAGIADERMLCVRRGGPDVDYTPQPLGQGAKA